MAQNRDQFAFVLAALRERLRAGAWVQGEPLTVNDLAAVWRVSATPVREALARLAGEGLVEDRRGRGYFAWRIDVSDLTDLYRAQEALTLTALTSVIPCTAQPEPAVAGPTPATGPVHRDRFDGVLFWEALTWRVARAAGHRFLLDAQQRLSDRLAPARRVEPMVLLEDAGALNGLAEQVSRRAWPALSADIAPFFARRCTNAGFIVDKLRMDTKCNIHNIEYK